MELNEKLEILIQRNDMKKTEFADKIGITYRALANYLSGSRTPKRSILDKIAETLNTSVDFLTDDEQTLILDSVELFKKNSTSDETDISSAISCIQQFKESIAPLSEDDRRFMFSCIAEIYFDKATDSEI